MRSTKFLGTVLVGLVTTLGAGSASGEPAQEDSSVAVAFADSAASLPQEDIRKAIARELENRPTDETVVAGELSIAVEGEHIVVRFRSAQKYTERVLPLPADRSQVPVMLGLLAGNLARDQRAGVRPEAAHAAKPVKQSGGSKPAAPSYQVHHFGVHLAQDILFVGGDNVCDPSAGQATDNFACYYAETEEPFLRSPDPTTDSIASGPVLATTRVLLSYDLAPWPNLSFGARLGLAFRGGPPAGMSPETTTLPIPAHTEGSGGTPFFPGHAEFRVSYWFAPLTNPRFRGFIGAGVGAAQIDAKVEHEIIDCDDVAALSGASNPADPTGEEARSTCMSGGGKAFAVEPTALDAWKKTGQGFGALHLGGSATLVGSLALELNLNAMLMFPALAFALEPSLGLVFGL